MKDVEKNRRSSGELIVQEVIQTTFIKQWSQLLSSGDFKNKLVTFLVNDWKTQGEILGARIFFFNNTIETYKVTSSLVEIVEDLQSNQEEADTRMLLHAQHASSTHEEVVLSTPDTDVFIIALSKLHKINAKLFMLTDFGEKRRLINLNELGERAANQLNNANCSNQMFLEALLGLHSFTGCDTSTFSGQGKTRSLNILGTYDEYIKTFRVLSCCEDLAQHYKRIIESFVCHMYGKKMHILKVL